MTRLVKKAIVACAVLATVGMAAGPAFAQGYGFLRLSRVQAFSTAVWQVQTGEYFRVVVDGDGDTDLDVFVYDAVTGRFLGADDDYTDYCIVSGRTDSGWIIVRVVNLGSVYNEYTIRVQ